MSAVPRFDRRQADHRLVADVDLARGRRLVAGDHAQDRRLAAARRADQAAIGAVRDGEVDRLARPASAERLGEVDEPDLAASLSRRSRSRGWTCVHGQVLRDRLRWMIGDRAERDGDGDEGDDRRHRAERIERRRGDVGGHRPDLERQRVLRADRQPAPRELVVGQREAEQRHRDHAGEDDRDDHVAERLPFRLAPRS